MLGSWLTEFAHWLQKQVSALGRSAIPAGLSDRTRTHFTGISLWLGTNVAVDLSLLGVGTNVKRRPNCPTHCFSGTGWDSASLCLAGFILFSVSAERSLSIRPLRSSWESWFRRRCNAHCHPEQDPRLGSSARCQNRRQNVSARLSFCCVFCGHGQRADPLRFRSCTSLP